MGDCYYIWPCRRVASHPVPQVRKILDEHDFAIVVAKGSGALRCAVQSFAARTRRAENKSVTMTARLLRGTRLAGRLGLQKTGGVQANS